MQRMTNVDGSFLISETSTSHMHVMGVIVLEPGELPADQRFEQMKDLFTAALPALPAFRRRAVEIPLGAAQAVWIEDPEFDLDDHMRRAAVPAPGGLRELAEFVGEYASHPLERSKPLWEAVLVEGLASGEVALVTKLHHAMMDGGAGLGFLARIFSLSEHIESAEAPEDEWQPERVPSLSELSSYAIQEELRRPLRLIGAAGEMARNVFESFSWGGADEVEAPSLFSAPRTSFNRTLTPHRSVAFGSCRLEDLKRVRKHFGVKINDVVLAATTSTLRLYLAKRDELPDEPLIASVPIAIAREDEDEGANSVSMMLIPLPVELDDPAERLLTIHDATVRGKEEHERSGGESVIQTFTDTAIAISTPGVLGGLTQLLSASHLADRAAPMWNVVVSNLAGSAVPLYCAGTRVNAVYPLGPVVDGVGLNFTLLSHEGKVDLGLMACRELVNGLDELIAGFNRGIVELVALSR